MLSSVSYSSDLAGPSGSPGMGVPGGSGSLTALNGVIGEVFGWLGAAFCFSLAFSWASFSSFCWCSSLAVLASSWSFFICICIVILDIHQKS